MVHRLHESGDAIVHRARGRTDFRRGAEVGDSDVFQLGSTLQLELEELKDMHRPFMSRWELDELKHPHRLPAGARRAQGLREPRVRESPFC